MHSSCISARQCPQKVHGRQFNVDRIHIRKAKFNAAWKKLLTIFPLFVRFFLDTCVL